MKLRKLHGFVRAKVTTLQGGLAAVEERIRSRAQERFQDVSQHMLFNRFSVFRRPPWKELYPASRSACTGLARS